MSCVLPCERKKQPGFTKLQEIGSNETSQGFRSKTERRQPVLVEQGDPKLIDLSLKKKNQNNQKGKKTHFSFSLNIVTLMSLSCFGIT